MNVNRAGADWVQIRAWLANELAASMSRLCDQQDENSTNYERGQVAAFRRLLDAVEPVKTPEVEDENYG